MRGLWDSFPLHLLSSHPKCPHSIASTSRGWKRILSQRPSPGAPSLKVWEFPAKIDPPNFLLSEFYEVSPFSCRLLHSSLRKRPKASFNPTGEITPTRPLWHLLCRSCRLDCLGKRNWLNSFRFAQLPSGFGPECCYLSGILSYLLAMASTNASLCFRSRLTFLPTMIRC